MINLPCPVQTTAVRRKGVPSRRWRRRPTSAQGLESSQCNSLLAIRFRVQGPHPTSSGIGSRSESVEYFFPSYSVLYRFDLRFSMIDPHLRCVSESYLAGNPWLRTAVPQQTKARFHAVGVSLFGRPWGQCGPPLTEFATCN